jgi:AsmA family
MKRVFQIVFGALALLVCAGMAAPKFRADDYRGRIQNAMDQGLGRHVTFGDVRYTLLTGPGFTLSKVSIGEDPAIGAEPIAYVEQLEATPRLWSLFTGHLEFSSLRLEDAHLNLSRNQLGPGQYRWNFEQLLRPSIIATFPNISIRGTRINFEADHMKSVVYLLDSDLDITPPSSSRETWKLRFEGKPARTDRPARGSGSFSAQGEWKPSNGTLDLNLQLDRSELGDLVALIRGEDIGLHGTVSGKAHLAGPPSALAINGRLNVGELHGWDQRVPQGETWPLDLSGLWNVGAQQLKLDASAAGKVAAHYLVEKYLSTPRWGVTVTFRDFSVDPLVAMAQHLGTPVPEGLKVAGQLDGVIGYSGGAGGNFEGRTTLKKASFTLPGSEPVLLENADVLITQGHVRLQPTHAVFPGDDTAEISGTYVMGDAAPEFAISTTGMAVHAVAGIPLLSGLKAGRWNGQLKYGEKAWTGSYTLSDAEWEFAGLSEPVRIESADGKIDGVRVSLQRIRARVGDILAQGEYRFEPGAVRPHRFRLGMAELDAAELERLVMPALARRNGLFGFRKSALPDWLKTLRADGTVEARLVRAGRAELENFRARVLWDAAHIAMPNVKAEWEGGQIASRILLDMSGKAPTYEAYARWSGIAFKGGTLDADTVMQTTGFGAALLTRLRSTGTITAHDVLEDYETVTGRFNLAWSATAPKLNFTELRLNSGGEVVLGKAALQDDGTVLVDIENGARQMKVALR